MSEMCTPIPVEAMSPAELLAEMRAVALERARLAAHEVRLLARFSALRTDPHSSADYAADEVAAELHLTPLAAARRVGTAVAMVEQLPDTVHALERGELDLQKATAIVEHTRVLPQEKATMVEAAVLKFAPGRTVRQIRDKLTREILTIDRAGAQARRQAAAKDAFVRCRPCPDGMAEMVVYDRAENIRPIFDLLTKTARSAKAAGNPTSVDELRTKALHDIVLGEGRKRVVTEFRVTIPASTLAGASRQPVEIHGYGPSTIDTIHELADQNTFWRRIITDPTTGDVLDVGHRRRHTNALGEHIRTRDKQCVFPGCPRPAEDCQIDHTNAHARGGPTTAANLGALCQHHNLMKQETNWTLHQPNPGRFVWTSPTGTTHEVNPKPLVEPDTQEDAPRHAAVTSTRHRGLLPLTPDSVAGTAGQRTPATGAAEVCGEAMGNGSGSNDLQQRKQREAGSGNRSSGQRAAGSGRQEGGGSRRDRQRTASSGAGGRQRPTGVEAAAGGRQRAAASGRRSGGGQRAAASGQHEAGASGRRQAARGGWRVAGGTRQARAAGSGQRAAGRSNEHQRRKQRGSGGGTNGDQWWAQEVGRSAISGKRSGSHCRSPATAAVLSVQQPCRHNNPVSAAAPPPQQPSQRSNPATTTALPTQQSCHRNNPANAAVLPPQLPCHCVTQSGLLPLSVQQLCH